MPTPYPSAGPGTPPSADLIQVPEWIPALTMAAGRDIARVAFRRGYRIGWLNSSSQYTEEKNVLRTLAYVLRRRSVDEDDITQILKCVKACLPKELGGEK